MENARFSIRGGETKAFRAGQRGHGLKIAAGGHRAKCKFPTLGRRWRRDWFLIICSDDSEVGDAFGCTWGGKERGLGRGPTRGTVSGS